MTLLRTRVLGRRIARFETLDSTSSECAREARVGEAEGLVVLAAEQTAGRGRFGRRWHSPRGGLWFSVLLRPRRDAETRCLLPLSAALCLARAVGASSRAEVRIRWPNDLLLRDRKLAGILCEAGAHGDAVVLGIGLNLALDPRGVPAEVARKSISLTEVAGGDAPGAIELLAAFLNEFESMYFGLDDPAVREGIVAAARSLTVGLGGFVSISLPGGEERERVKALDIEPDGALLIEDEEGVRRRILSGVLEVPN